MFRTELKKLSPLTKGEVKALVSTESLSLLALALLDFRVPLLFVTLASSPSLVFSAAGGGDERRW